MTKAGFIKLTITCAVIVTITASLIWIHSLTEFSSDHLSNQQIDSFVKNAQGEQFSINGHLTKKTFMSLLKHYPKLDMSTFQNPHIVLYSIHSKPWRIKADHGNATHQNKLIELIGHVVVHQDATGQQSATTIKSKQMLYNVNKHIIDTNAHVSIIRDKSITHAKGLTFNLKTNQLVLKSHMVTDIAGDDTKLG
jgi:LPS export ABC transporter protein LptC